MIESSIVQNVERLKNLPKTWKIKNFTTLVSDNSAGNKKLAKSDFLEEGDIAIVDQGKELVAGFYNDTSIAVKTSPPYIIFGDHTRIFKFIDFPFIMGADGTKVLQPVDNRCETKYLYYFFLSIDVPNTGYNRHYKYLKDLKIPLPPIEIQKKIAAILDTAESYKQKTKALIDKYDALTQSLFLEMFGDPVSNPKGFQIVSLSSHGEFKNGLNFKKNESGIKIKYLGVGDFKSRYKIDDVDNLSDIELDSLPNDGYLLKDGDLVFVRSNGNRELVGRCVEVYPKKSELTFSGFCIRYRITSSDIKPAYLSQLFRNKSFKSLMLQGGRGANIQNINQQMLSDIKIPLPKIYLQNQFSIQIQSIESQKAMAQQSLTKAEELFNSLLQKAFKGELV